MPDEKIPILKGMFDDSDEDFKVENLDDFFFKYSGPFYSIFKHRIPDFFREIKWSFQRLFRKHGCADIDLWSLDYHLAKIILPKLMAFRAQELQGHPISFSDWSEDEMGMTKEEYDKAKEKGDFIGGGQEAWMKTIDEMIFAFEYLLNADSFDKKQEKFYKKYGYKDPYRKTDDNLTWGYNYKTKEGHSCFAGESDLEEKKGYILIGKHKIYHDMDVLKEVGIRAIKGFELFGKYFMNLWD
jgi:hypothetical protein